jgi:hypothetical protein
MTYKVERVEHRDIAVRAMQMLRDIKSGVGFDAHWPSRQELAEGLLAEIDRLREIEARDVAVTNLFVAFRAAGEGKISEDEFAGIISSMDRDLGRAVEHMARRDKIRKLEGAIEELKHMIRYQRDSATCAAANLLNVFALRHASEADRMEKRMVELEQQLADTKAGK